MRLVPELQDPQLAANIPINADIEHLMSLSRAWIHSLNTRQFQANPMLSYIASDFRADCCFVNGPTAPSFEVHLDQVQQEFELFPDYHIRIVEMTATAHEKTSAKDLDIFLHVEVTGRPAGTKRQLLEIMKWRRDEPGSRWVWWELMLMPGENGITPVSMDE